MIPTLALPKGGERIPTLVLPKGGERNPRREKGEIIIVEMTGVISTIIIGGYCFQNL